MIQTQHISELMNEHGIGFEYRPADFHDRWLIPVPNRGMIEVTLNETNENLLFRTGPIVDLRDKRAEVAARILRNAMDANDFLPLGRFVGTNEIHFEVPMCFPGSSHISSDQFMHALTTTIGNLVHGRSILGVADDQNDDELPEVIRNRLYPPN